MRKDEERYTPEEVQEILRIALQQRKDTFSVQEIESIYHLAPAAQSGRHASSSGGGAAATTGKSPVRAAIITDTN